MTTATQNITWEDKEPALFWRGGDTSEARRVLARSEVLKDHQNTKLDLMKW